MRVIKKDTANAPEPEDYCFSITAIIIAAVAVSFSQLPAQASPDNTSQSLPSNDSTNQIHVIPNTVTSKKSARTTDERRHNKMNESSNRATCSPFTSLVFPTDNLIATTEFAAAYASQIEGRLPDATTRYKAVLKQLPECFEAYYNLGLCLREQEHLTEALSAFESTARLHPLFKMVYKDLADLYTKAGQASNAEAAIAAYSQL